MRIFRNLFLFLFITNSTATIRGEELQKTLTRKKRFLTFPKGTVIQLVYCYLMSALGTEGIFTVGVTLGTNWDVPVDLDKLMYDEHRKVMANRRDRRSIYPKIAYVLDQLGVDGKNHIKKLLCHARKRRQRNSRHKLTFIEEIIDRIFQYPRFPAQIYQPIDEYDHMLSQCEQNESIELRSNWPKRP